MWRQTRVAALFTLFIPRASGSKCYRNEWHSIWRHGEDSTFQYPSTRSAYIHHRCGDKLVSLPSSFHLFCGRHPAVLGMKRTRSVTMLCGTRRNVFHRHRHHLPLSPPAAIHLLPAASRPCQYTVRVYIYTSAPLDPSVIRKNSANDSSIGLGKKSINVY